MNENIHRFADNQLPRHMGGKATKFFDGKSTKPFHNGLYLVKVVTEVYSATANGNRPFSIAKKTRSKLYFSRFVDGVWYCPTNYIHTAEVIKQPSANQNRDWQGLVEEFK